MQRKPSWLQLMSIFWMVMLLAASVTGFQPSSAFAQGTVSDTIVVDMEHIIVTPGDTQATLLHIVTVKNKGSKQFIGDKTTSGATAVFQVELPKGAVNLQIMGDDAKSAVQTDAGFYTIQPIAANQSVNVTYSYQLPQTGGHFLLSYKRPYPVNSLNVLVPQGKTDLNVQNRQMQDNGAMDFEGTSYHVYSTDSIKADQQLDMVMLPHQGGSGQSAQNGTTTQTAASNVTRKAPDFHSPGHIRLWTESPLRDFNPHIFLIVISAILIFGLGYYGYRKFKHQNLKSSFLSQQDEVLFQQLLLKQKVILNKLVDLEESYERAELSDEEYNERREAYKSRLMAVKLELRELE